MTRLIRVQFPFNVIKNKINSKTLNWDIGIEVKPMYNN